MRRLLFSISAIAAFGSGSMVRAQEPQREAPPPPGPLRPFTLPPVRETQLGNGLRLVVLERPGLPIVHARIVVNAGAVHEPAAESGLAALTGALLVEGGAGDMTGAEFARRSEALGATIASQASYSFAGVVVTSLRESFAEALALGAAAVREPTFEPREFERVSAQAVAAYERSQATAEGVADRLFSQAVYDSVAPYSRDPGGTAATLGALSRDAVVSWHRRMYTPANAIVLMVGDIQFESAVALVTRLFADWSRSPSGAVLPLNPTRSTERPRVILVDRPGSVQSAVYVGVPGVATPDSDFFRMTVLDRVLGGGFTSRINRKLREERGFTYGAFTTLAALQNAGTFYASSSVRTSATDSALAEILVEFSRAREEEAPATELQAAVDNLVAGFPASIQTVQDLAERMLVVLIYGLPIDYYATYRERLAAVGAADVQAVAHARLRPDAVTMVVVGDLAQIEERIRARGFGDVEVWDREGARLR